MNRFGRIICGVSAAFLYSGASADEFHYSNLLVGERPSALAGAYTAISDDHLGMVYNPAGIVDADPEKDVASINLYVGSTTTYEKVFGDSGWTRTSGELVPGFFGGLSKISDTLMLGYSLYVRDSLSEDQDQIFENVTTQNNTFDEVRINNNLNYRWYDASLSLGAKLNETVRIGGSFGLHYRTHQVAFNQRIRNVSAANQHTSNSTLWATAYSNRDWTEIGVRPSFGVKLGDEERSFGMTVSKVMLLSREYRYQSSFDYVDTANPATAASQSSLDESEQKQKFPLVVRLGAASKFGDSNRVMFDVAWFGKTSHQYEFEGNVAAADVPPVVLDTRSFVNVALGAEIGLDQPWTWRMGVFSDFSNTEVADARALERREEIDTYGVTLSVTRNQADGKYWNIGGMFAYGSGEATLGDYGFGQGTNPVVDATRTLYSIYVGRAW